jgi:hypothetical protein
MLTDRTLSGLLPWWLFGYVATALWLCMLVGWSRIARSLAIVFFGAPAVTLGTLAAQQFMPPLVCELLFVQYLLVVLTQASSALFGSAVTHKTVQAMLVYGLLRPLLWLADLCLSSRWQQEPEAVDRKDNWTGD